MVSQNIQAMNYVTSMSEHAPVATVGRGAISSSRVFKHVFWTVILILIPVFLMVIFNSINVQKEYTMQGIRSDVMRMAKENDVMRLEVSKLEAPIRIQKIAETQLKMSLPLKAVYGGADPVTPERNKGR